MCQAFAIPPSRKYENEGGPGIRNIVELLRTYSTSPSEDVGTFVDSVAFNWLIGGTDAHAKNYSLLINAERVRLAPLYDITSVLPYSDFDIQKMKLAMKLGGEYRLRNIRINHWRNLAKELHFDPDVLVQRVRDLASQLADHSSAISRGILDRGLTNPIVSRLADAVAARAVNCQNVLRAVA